MTYALVVYGLGVLAMLRTAIVQFRETFYDGRGADLDDYARAMSAIVAWPLLAFAAAVRALWLLFVEGRLPE